MGGGGGGGGGGGVEVGLNLVSNSIKLTGAWFLLS